MDKNTNDLPIITENNVTKEKIIQDLNQLITDVSLFTRNYTNNNLKKDIEEIKEQIDVLYSKAIDRATVIKDKTFKNANNIKDKTKKYINDKPLKSVGIAAGIGLLIGLIINKK